MSKKPLFYKPPVDEYGKPYWVPVVIKNKDVLIGFIESLNFVSIEAELDPMVYYVVLGSDRFNDILKTGKRSSEMSDFQFKEYIKSLVVTDIEKTQWQLNHADDTEDLLDEYYFHVSCECGNFYGFSGPDEIPEEQFKCGLCDKVIIDYTHKFDHEHEYDGKMRDVDSVLEIVRKELDIDPGEEE